MKREREYQMESKCLLGFLLGHRLRSERHGAKFEKKKEKDISEYNKRLIEKERNEARIEESSCDVDEP